MRALLSVTSEGGREEYDLLACRLRQQLQQLVFLLFSIFRIEKYVGARHTRCVNVFYGDSEGLGIMRPYGR